MRPDYSIFNVDGTPYPIQAMKRVRPLPDEQPCPTWMVVSIGILALAAAMGIGRFAFTPLLPLMLRDGTLDAAGGAEWAAANYTGYLAGAVTARWLAGNPARGLRWSLVGVAVTTLAAAGGPALYAGLLLRAAAGLFSAWVLVCASGFILGELTRRRVPQWGAWIYTGVGLGIALSGTLAWLGGWQPAHWLWLELGIVAAAAAAAVGMGLRELGRVALPLALSATAASGGHRALVLCYGVSGFGYIVPATFLPAMARQQVSNPLVFGLAWPLFGLAATLSVAVTARWLSGWPRRRVWALAQGVMAVGTALPILTQALWALAGSAVLVGGTFMVTTMAGLQMARELRPAEPTPLLSWMTMSFAAGQIAGPLLVRLLAPVFSGDWNAMACANAASTALLALTAAWLWRGAKIPLSASLSP